MREEPDRHAENFPLFGIYKELGKDRFNPAGTKDAFR